MGSILRKIFVLSLALAAALSLYLIYHNITKPVEFELKPSPELAQVLHDVNASRPAGPIGKIHGIGVEQLKRPRFQHRNEAGRMDWELAFDQLAHRSGDVWEVDRPEMSFYHPRFDCRVTADKGTIRLEDPSGNPTPKYAAFSGNVLIEISSTGAGRSDPTRVYLDDLSFLSDNSRFVTAGPVRLVSETASLKGRGLEFVYDPQLGRLEYLRLEHLDELRARIARGTLAQGRRRDNITISSADGGGGDRDGATAGDRGVSIDQPAGSPDAGRQPAQNGRSGQEAASSQFEYYKCILSKNVVIEGPDYVVRAADALIINDLLWSRQTIDSTETQTEAPSSSQSSTEVTTAAAEPEPPVERAATEPPQGPGQAGSSKQEPEVQTVEIVTTCQNGLLFVPENSTRSVDDFPAAKEASAGGTAWSVGPVVDPNGRTVLVSPRIVYSLASERATAQGPTYLSLYNSSTSARDTNSPPVPVTLTAEGGATHDAATNQVVFEGDCLCKMPQQLSSGTRFSTLTSPRLVVELAGEDANQATVAAALTAEGPVSLTFYIESLDANEPNAVAVPVTVTAQRQARFLPDSNQVVFDGNCLCVMPQGPSSTEHGYVLSAPRLTVNLASQTEAAREGLGDVIAAGPAELTFYVEPFGSTVDKRRLLPATLTAHKQAAFLARSNQVVFEGDCFCSMTEQDPNGRQQQYSLTAPRIAVDLPGDSDAAGTSSSGIEYLRADGGLVRLATIKKYADKKLLGGIVLDCRKFEYDPNQQVFVATGPGIIQLNHSSIPEPNIDPGRVSFRRPCYAFLQNFDRLRYYLTEDRFVADATSQGALRVDYMPLRHGKVTQHVQATAGHVEAKLHKTEQGQTELLTLTATDGIFCQDEDHQFVGGRLFYDHRRSLMQISGTAQFPCQFDGALVDRIEYDLNTGKVEARIVGPGAIQLNR